MSHNPIKKLSSAACGVTAISPASRRRRVQASTSGQVRRRAMDRLRAASNEKLITDKERKAAMKYISADASQPHEYFRETIAQTEMKKTKSILLFEDAILPRAALHPLAQKNETRRFIDLTSTSKTT